MFYKRLYVSVLLLFLSVVKLYGQVPAISYPSPKTYFINSPIPVLTPSNTGGSIPPNVYGMVSLFAGQTGVQGASGGSLGQSQFISPLSICVNTPGNIFVNDPANKAIKEISPNGNVVFRSQGVPENIGVPPSPNNFNTPTGIAADANDNVYIADTDNNLIRMVAADKTISNFAGNRTPLSLDGIGTAAGFNKPTEMTIDAGGNLYVVDNGYSNNKIRKITPAGVVTTLFTLTNNTKIGGIVRDASGNFFVTKPIENTIEKISSTGVVSVFAGSGSVGSMDGIATTATLDTPSGIAIDGDLNLYVVSTADNLVRKITAAGAVITFAGQLTAGSADGVGTAASFKAPTGIAFNSSGSGYIADNGNYTIRKISINGYTIDKALPSGLVFDNTTGTISGTPTAVFPATTYTITGYNNYGSSVATLILQVLASPLLTFNPIDTKTTCSADFSPATSANNIAYTSSNLNVATIVNGQLHIVGAGTAIITANDGVSVLTQLLTVTSADTPTISISTNPNPICDSAPAIFSSVVTNGGTNPVYQWKVNGVSKANSSIYTAFLNDGDVVSCTLTANTACTTPIVSNPITIHVNQQPTVSFAPAEVGVRQGDDIVLQPVVTGNIVSYQWTPSTGLNDASISNPVAKPATKTTYNLTVTTGGGCQANASITVDVNSYIILHNSFTPNNDGVNDTWNIPDLAYFPGCTVKIYNRFGTLVYDTVNYAQPWDGTLKGSPLSAGAYYYIIDPKNNTPVLKGEVTLIR